MRGRHIYWRDRGGGGCARVTLSLRTTLPS